MIDSNYSASLHTAHAFECIVLLVLVFSKNLGLFVFLEAIQFQFKIVKTWLLRTKLLL
jgi:hypothetical protein